MKTYNYKYENRDLAALIPFEKFFNQANILVQIFCGEKKENLAKITKELKHYLPLAVVIGTTTDGEIDNNKIYTHTTIISISVFNQTEVTSAHVLSKNDYENGVNLATKLIKENTKLLILFTDGTSSNGEEFLKGIESVNNEVVICGGMAGDNGEFIQTYICDNEQIISQGAVGVALNSDILEVYNDYRFNWSPIGVEHTIDEIHENRVYKISGMTAVDFYQKYLGEEVAKKLPSTGIEFPFIVERNGLMIARAVIARHSDGSLSFAGNLKVGDKVRLGFGNAEMIMKKSIETFNEISAQNAQTFFIYSCMARRRYMPNLINIEIDPFVKVAPTVGFFTYAEFYHNKGHNELLNQTFTVVGLCEANIKERIKPTQKVIKKSHEENEYAVTIGALTHLIAQSTLDYDKQRVRLQTEKYYSNNLLKSQDLFIKHAVHETNTPLSVIMNNIELFEMEYGKNPYLSNIEAAMKNVFSIYDDLSYLIKNEQIIYVKHNIDLVDYLRSRIEFFDIVAKKGRLSFHLQSSLEHFNLYFNETKLQRIIDNNITNAIKYTKENEIIFIILKKEKNGCSVTFKSKSSQIENPSKIFEEFYREHSNQKGFGLGLNLVKEICDSEHIKIELKSNEDETAFIYYFKGENE
ncbi:MAG: FIST N-terminal domain-containing protein [Candidatus Marinarcus sp.]|uniref:FIST N-terminal domain-containing protein n=1 Tax=Candidatus Marinarcus sp. TaxID=3100987 RepID=UPI003AFFC900